MADTPIKTQVMVALCEALSAIPELATVNRFRGKPIDLETELLPALYVYEDKPEQRRRENRMQIGVLDLLLAVFFKLDLSNASQAFSDEADTIQAEIHSLLFGTSNLNNIGVLKVEEIEVSKDYPDDNYGILAIRLSLTYGHQFGNAFTTLAR